MVNYDLLNKQLKAITEDVDYAISNLANAAALLWEALPDINWAGFYLLQDEKLVLGPFQGKTACVTIPIGKGVCGTAVAQAATQLVPDVHKFPGHIACDSASNAEIVVPLWKEGKIIAVMDIDSPTKERFTDYDRNGLERFAQILQDRL